jgi:predicted metal-binding membrane protein
MDVLALILTVAAMVMFLFAASGRELRRFNEIAVGLVLLSAALICQFTSITNTHIGRLAGSPVPPREIRRPRRR